jgi:hypothetical protein
VLLHAEYLGILKDEEENLETGSQLYNPQIYSDEARVM